MKLITIELDKSRTLNTRELRDEFMKVSVGMTFDMSEHNTDDISLEECYAEIGRQVSSLMNQEAKRTFDMIKNAKKK